MIKVWIKNKIAAPFRPLWDWYCWRTKEATEEKRLADHQKAIKKALAHHLAKKRIEQQTKDMPYYPGGKVVLLRKNPADDVLNELAKADIESGIELDPGTVRQIKDTGRSIRG